eukprot:symbB.v1.2.015733.t1/scaffold1184.1/size176679/13
MPNNLWPGAKNIPSTLKVVFSWAERCDVELGRAWKAAGVKMADLLIATEYFLTFASCHLELAKSQDGREAHLMRPLGAAKVFILDQESLTPMPDANPEVTGMLGVAGPQVTPGYVERLDDGRAVIGAGPLSQDIFKVINDEWVLVPKDIVKKRPDQSIVSIGRGGGLVKTLGGVLVATGVAELQLTSGAVSACCITDPLHSEGGQTVVLETRSAIVANNFVSGMVSWFAATLTLALRAAPRSNLHALGDASGSSTKDRTEKHARPCNGT